MLLFDRRAPAPRPRVRGAAPAQIRPSSRSHRRAAAASLRSRPISTRNRARCDSSACFARNARASSVASRHVVGQASASARASANSTGRRRERDHRVVRRARHSGRHPRRALSTPAALRPRRAAEGAPRRAQSGAPRACSRTRDALSTSAISAGIPAVARGDARRGRARRAPPSSAGAASRSRPPTSSWAARQRGREGRRDRARRARARPRRGVRSGAGAGPAR